jgi:hypothetical protein
MIPLKQHQNNEARYNIPHTALAVTIHASNVEAGWWTNIKTGESIVETRNRPEIMMLIVSELSEASDGWRLDSWDDKLPQFAMFDVELADTAIRLYDLLGAECGDTNFDETVRNYHQSWRHDRIIDDGDVQYSLMMVVNCVSAAMEGYRKGNRDVYFDALCQALGGVYAVADRYAEHDLSHLINEKRRFNADRSDHKIENRLKDDGKKF